MVVSIVLAVVLAGVLIWLFTQQEQLRATAESATAMKNKLVKGNEENLARQMVPDAGATGKTMVGELVRTVQMMSGRLTGNQNDPPQTALTKFDGVLKKIATDKKVPSVDKVSGALGASAVVENLYQFYTNELETRQKAETDRDNATKKAEAASASAAELAKNFKDQYAKLNSKVEELQNAKSEFERLKSADIESLQSQILAKRDELDNMRRDTSNSRRQLIGVLSERENLLNEQKAALATLRGPGAEGSQEMAVARNPVGKVMRALPGAALVGIDLGRRDHVVLGLTFTVYSGNERIPVDGRGKALVEVVSLGERTSECRVVSTPSPDDPILEGDKVGNIVLSRDRAKKQRFVVIGNFDTDFDGQPDARGADLIKGLVARYGGTVVDRVDAMTDYVIVGTEPAGPDIMSPAAAPAEEAAEEAKDNKGDAKDKSESDAEESDSGDEKKASADEDEKPSDEVEAGDDKEKSGDEKEASEDDDKGDKESGDDAAGDDEKPDTKKPDTKKPQPAPVKKSAPIPITPTPAPTVSKSPEVDVTEGPRMRREMSDRQKYEEAIRRAEKFAIPRLTADRFYNFIGLERGPIAVRQLEQ
jgi:hypothetical protein